MKDLELELLLSTDEIALDWQIEALKELYKEEVKKEMMETMNTIGDLEELLHTYLTVKSETREEKLKKYKK